MALVRLQHPIAIPTAWPTNDVSTETVDAANEEVACVGHILWTDEGTHTVSSAGGKMAIGIYSATWANVGTNVRIGIQDTSAGLPDGTFDVYADLVPGTETIAAGLREYSMETGSKSIAHAQEVALVFRMTARGGVADTIEVMNINNVQSGIARGGGHPYFVRDGAKSGNNITPMAVIADDGTVGYFYGCPPRHTYVWSWTLNTGTNPDEICSIITHPFAGRVSGIGIMFGDVDATDDGELLMYSDPKGTPAVVSGGTITVDADVLGASLPAGLPAAPYVSIFHFATPIAVAAGDVRGYAWRPTTANSSDVYGWDGGSTNGAAYRAAASPYGTAVSLGTRQNQTGAFSELLYRIPCIFPVYSAFDDGAGGGGGGARGYLRG